ncbi:gliding motility protein MglA [hydrothermal vent metagenome]|uniref:Gliding motility protein MglA n=1 Tax=hydrothermal vent metagenome TaxID=652676 RepID=A0A3B1CHP3_9ZZZZ
MQINYAKKEVSCKLVYYGPGMSGKTTNLEVVHQRVPDRNKGEMTSIATEGDRTLFFDFLPLDLGKVRGLTTKFQLYTVPGQVYYSSTRKLVLQGADGIIFVADSQADKIEENIAALKDLENNLADYGIKLTEIPLVIQWNKRDLPNALPVEELEKKVNHIGAASSEAVAAIGDGVLSTLKLAASMILGRLNSKEPPAGARKAVQKANEKEPERKDDVFVARVNADKISRSYFNQYCQARHRLTISPANLEDFKKFNVEEKKKLLKSLINHVLLLQDAKRRNISASKEETDSQIKEIAKRFGPHKNIDAFLSNRKLSMDNLRNEAIKNVIIGKIVKEVIPRLGERMKVTHEDVTRFYNANASGLGGKSLDDVKNQIAAKLKQRKKRVLLSEFYSELRKRAQIEIFEENI